MAYMVCVIWFCCILDVYGIDCRIPCYTFIEFENLLYKEYEDEAQFAVAYEDEAQFAVAGYRFWALLGYCLSLPFLCFSIFYPVFVYSLAFVTALSFSHCNSFICSLSTKPGGPAFFV
ncbi:hypothetical protein AMTRI_Chr11g98680 [Amborella trichopoda]